MKINNKISWGLATGALCITIAGAFNGTALLGLVSITAGALALVTALLAKQQIEKKKLKPELALELK
jgi:asparagine N-glycosylation enzyme membrane subunit Stt3